MYVLRGLTTWACMCWIFSTGWMQKESGAIKRSKPQHVAKTIEEKVASDPARIAAIAALKAKRAAENGGRGSSSVDEKQIDSKSTQPTSAIFTKSPSGQMKLKFIIPKKEEPSSLKKRKPKAIITDSDTSEDEKAVPITNSNAPQTSPKHNKADSRNVRTTTSPRKRPTLKRPSLRFSKENHVNSRDQETSQRLHIEQNSEVKQNRRHTDNSTDGAENQKLDHEIGKDVAGHVSRILYVGNLPEHFTVEKLWEIFEPFDGILDISICVHGEQHGIVVFRDLETAKAVFDFSSQQGGGIYADGVLLSLAWADIDSLMGEYNAYDSFEHENGDQAEHLPTELAADVTRKYAQNLMETLDQEKVSELAVDVEDEDRGLVSYDDL